MTAASRPASGAGRRASVLGEKASRAREPPSRPRSWIAPSVPGGFRTRLATSSAARASAAADAARSATSSQPTPSSARARAKLSGSPSGAAPRPLAHGASGPAQPSPRARATAPSPRLAPPSPSRSARVPNASSSPSPMPAPLLPEPVYGAPAPIRSRRRGARYHSAWASSQTASRVPRWRSPVGPGRSPPRAERRRGGPRQSLGRPRLPAAGLPRLGQQLPRHPYRRAGRDRLPALHHGGPTRLRRGLPAAALDRPGRPAPAPDATRASSAGGLRLPALGRRQGPGRLGRAEGRLRLRRAHGGVGADLGRRNGGPARPAPADAAARRRAARRAGRGRPALGARRSHRDRGQRVRTAAGRGHLGHRLDPAAAATGRRHAVRERRLPDAVRL